MKQSVCPTYVGMNRTTSALLIICLAVCPTYVGMNRSSGQICTLSAGMPHVCGDEPDRRTPDGIPLDVCPTYVGMNRRLAKWAEALLAYAPRMWG